MVSWLLQSHHKANITINDIIKLTELEQLVLSEIELNPYVRREEMGKSVGDHLEHFKEFWIV